jgi:hypothetical protein
MAENYLTKHVSLEDRADAGYGSLLRCPACNHDYTHHGQVDVFERSEDQAGLHVRIEDGAAKVDGDLSGNPSARRHGLTVVVECESCGSNSLLGLEQHKGQTFLRWLKTGKPTR